MHIQYIYHVRAAERCLGGSALWRLLLLLVQTHYGGRAASDGVVRFVVRVERERLVSLLPGNPRQFWLARAEGSMYVCIRVADWKLPSQKRGKNTDYAFSRMGEPVARTSAA